jgi:hypothetical protein
MITNTKPAISISIFVVEKSRMEDVPVLVQMQQLTTEYTLHKLEKEISLM